MPEVLKGYICPLLMFIKYWFIVIYEICIYIFTKNYKICILFLRKTYKQRRIFCHHSSVTNKITFGNPFYVLKKLKYDFNFSKIGLF